MRKDFKLNDKIQRLLWCDRHCCLCGKQCGVHIEFAHIGDPKDYNIDNSIPLCYKCHARIGMYNNEHPRGNKYKSEELKKRREQIYEKHTRQYIVPIKYIISNYIDPNLPNSGLRKYPSVTFNIANLSDYLPISLEIKLKGKLNGKSIDIRIPKGFYTGDKRWNINPQRIINGWFEIKNTRLLELRNSDSLGIRVSIKIVDVLGREHSLLEDGYNYNQKSEPYWYFEP